jgi:DNA-directed RNA polymerase subunit RPC12/RpoP
MLCGSNAVQYYLVRQYMQTKFICPHCSEEIFSWGSISLDGVPIACPHCGRGSLTSPHEEESDAFAIYSKPVTILWLAVRWLFVGGGCLILLLSAFAILFVDVRLSLLAKLPISLMLIMFGIFLAHVAAYGKLSKYSKFGEDAKAHKARIESIKRSAR